MPIRTICETKIFSHSSNQDEKIKQVSRCYHGHENRATTEIYLHSIVEAEREVMVIFEHVTVEAHIERKRT
jgi:hypothetical protein